MFCDFSMYIEDKRAEKSFLAIFNFNSLTIEYEVGMFQYYKVQQQTK